jgi:hypothetical protein
MKKNVLDDRNTGRVVALLTRDEIDFIDRLSKDALFSTGHKLSRTDIIRALIGVVKANDINGDGVHSKSDLEKKLLSIMKIQVTGPLRKLKRKRYPDERN